ncbi:MAG: NAD-dependent epimerase/dehydratase family protein [Clostridiales bacterium]|nr:NAD-dependent epimerase/dehydratase family protein [Clostridiales bacterium]
MILVTGATGFLGKRVCKKLDERGLPYIKTALSLGADLRNPGQTMTLFESVKPEYVLHCAAYVGGIQFGLKHTAEMFSNNLLMSINLFEACRRYQVKRLVNPISNCSYPAKATLFREDEYWDGPLHDSVATYGFVRKASFVGAQAYAKQYGQDTINIILSNMYGPEDHFEEERSHAMGALIMKMVKAKREDLPEVVVWGTGTPVREWLHIDDGAEAMIRAMKIQETMELLNIGVASGVSIKEMAEMIQREVGYAGKLVFDTSKADGDPYKTVDGSRARAVFGWAPEINLEQGIRDTVKWYLENR